MDISESMHLVEDTLEGNRLIGLMSTKDSSIRGAKPDQVYEMGTLAKIHEGIRLPDNTMQVVVEGMERFDGRHAGRTPDQRPGQQAPRRIVGAHS